MQKNRTAKSENTIQEKIDRKRKLRKGKLAEATGLEPATSTVTGWHSNQLSYASAFLQNFNKTGGSDGARTRNIHRDRVAL